jgi:hypothetical protein
MHSSGDHGRDLVEHVGARMASEARSAEQAEGVDSSMTVDITDHRAPGARCAGSRR